MRVIVADDDLTQRAYLGALLTRAGHEPILTADGSAALDSVLRGDGSLLVCDIEMPHLDGIELARRVRAEKLGRYVYILLITGRDRPEDYAAGLGAGADDFMSKPIDPSILSVRLAAAERVLAYDRELTDRTDRLASAMHQLELDLRAAADTQRALLPARDCRLNGCRARSFLMPSSFVSGDVFDYFAIDDRRTGFYAADVSGHGVRAALLAVSIGHLIRRESFAAMALADRRAEPHRMIAELNQRFCARLREEEFFTMVAGVIDEARGEVILAHAGHPPPVLITAAGEARWLETGGLPVGLFAEATFESVACGFSQGDRLVIYSDGAIEAESAAGLAFGETRLLDFLRPRLTAAPEAIADDLRQTLAAWSGDAAGADDISMIIFDK